MPNARYARGAARERQWAERLKGWEVVRAAGSTGAYDLMACRSGEVVLWEVKTTAAGPFADFGPAKREAIREAAQRAGGTARLVWWPTDRKGPRIIPESAWP